MRFCRQLFHVTGKILLQCIESSSDVTPLFFWQGAELLPRFFFDLDAIAHCFCKQMVMLFIAQSTSLGYSSEVYFGEGRRNQLAAGRVRPIGGHASRRAPQKTTQLLVAK
jgi:hypothetical protein